MSLDGERKPDYLQKAHADTGKTCIELYCNRLQWLFFYYYLSFISFFILFICLITFQIGCLCLVFVSHQVLESFKIMDYSLLLGIHVLDRRPLNRGSRCDSRRGQKVLYSTALESIQGNVKDPEPVADDETWGTFFFSPVSVTVNIIFIRVQCW